MSKQEDKTKVDSQRGEKVNESLASVSAPKGELRTEALLKTEVEKVERICKAFLRLQTNVINRIGAIPEGVINGGGESRSESKNWQLSCIADACTNLKVSRQFITLSLKPECERHVNQNGTPYLTDKTVDDLCRCLNEITTGQGSWPPSDGKLPEPIRQFLLESFRHDIPYDLKALHPMPNTCDGLQDYSAQIPASLVVRHNRHKQYSPKTFVKAQRIIDFLNRQELVGEMGHKFVNEFNREPSKRLIQLLGEATKEDKEWYRGIVGDFKYKSDKTLSDSAIAFTFFGESSPILLLQLETRSGEEEGPLSPLMKADILGFSDEFDQNLRPVIDTLKVFLSLHTSVGIVIEDIESSGAVAKLLQNNGFQEVNNGGGISTFLFRFTTEGAPSTRTAEAIRLAELEPIVEMLHEIEGVAAGVLQSSSDKIALLQKSGSDDSALQEFKDRYSSSLAKLQTLAGIPALQLRDAVSKYSPNQGLNEVDLRLGIEALSETLANECAQFLSGGREIDELSHSFLKYYETVLNRMTGRSVAPELLNLEPNWGDSPQRIGTPNSFAVFDPKILVDIWVRHHGINETIPRNSREIDELRHDFARSPEPSLQALLARCGPEVSFFEDRDFLDYVDTFRFGGEVHDILSLFADIRKLNSDLEIFCRDIPESPVETIHLRGNQISREDPIFQEIVELNRPLYRAPGDPDTRSLGVVLSFYEAPAILALRDMGANFVQIREEGELKGYCIYFEEAPEWASESVEQYGRDTKPGFIAMLYSTPQLASRGGAAALIDAVTAQLASKGRDSLIGAVEHSNERAMNFWQKKGWILMGEQIEEKEGAKTKSGETGHFVRMYHSINPNVSNRFLDARKTRLLTKLESEMAIVRHYEANKVDSLTKQRRHNATVALVDAKPQIAPCAGTDLTKLFTTLYQEGVENFQVMLCGHTEGVIPLSAKQKDRCYGVTVGMLDGVADGFYTVEPRGMDLDFYEAVERFERSELASVLFETRRATAVLLVPEESSGAEALADVVNWLNKGLPVILQSEGESIIEEEIRRGCLNGHLTPGVEGRLISISNDRGELLSILESLESNDVIPEGFISDAILEGFLHLRGTNYKAPEYFPDHIPAIDYRDNPGIILPNASVEAEAVPYEIRALATAYYLFQQIEREEARKDAVAQEKRGNRGGASSLINEKIDSFQVVSFSQQVSERKIVSPALDIEEHTQNIVQCKAILHQIGIGAEFTSTFRASEENDDGVYYYQTHGLVDSVNGARLLDFVKGLSPDTLLHPSFFEAAFEEELFELERSEIKHIGVTPHILMSYVLYEILCKEAGKEFSASRDWGSLLGGRHRLGSSFPHWSKEQRDEAGITEFLLILKGTSEEERRDLVRKLDIFEDLLVVADGLESRA